MQSEPRKEHQWLQKLVGKLTFEGEAAMEQGKPSPHFRKGAGHRVLTSHILGDDNQWHEIANYHRQQ